MSPDLQAALGGLGLFLLGMLLLTEGLRAWAGDRLRSGLARFTRTPWSGALSGAVATAMVQSSSATTVTAVGFVGAGVLEFSQALGILFGANLGSTVTGWLVALLGFRVDLGAVAFPGVLFGVGLRLFGRERLRNLGWVVAGFSLLFVGLAAMQAGLANFEGVVTPRDFPPDTWLGRLQLVGIGFAITTVTQASSAGVATALVALQAGTITLQQGGALVIGMDVATTLSALYATIGGSRAMRRTGMAHVVFNLMTGLLAFALLDPLLAATATLFPPAVPGNAQLALVAFHTSFNALGVLLVLPLTRPFARLLEALVPERAHPRTARLDRRLLAHPAAALDATAATLGELAHALFEIFDRLLGGHPLREPAATLTVLEEDLGGTRSYLEQIRSPAEAPELWRRQLSCMHALDHLLRLQHRAAQSERGGTLLQDARLRRLAAGLRRALPTSDNETRESASPSLYRWHRLLRDQRRSYRERLLRHASLGRISTRGALQRLDSLRWLSRAAYHAWRLAEHLRIATGAPLRDASDELARSETVGSDDLGPE